MSTISEIVGLMDGLSNSELEQAVAVAQIRLGNRGPVSGGNPGNPRRQSSRGRSGQSGRGGQISGRGRTGRGNPARKSQWATHPLYVEYSRLKKLVEAQAKEGKIPFNQVASDESVEYRRALEAWLVAKATFRPPPGQPGGQNTQTPTGNPSSNQASGSMSGENLPSEAEVEGSVPH